MLKISCTRRATASREAAAQRFVARTEVRDRLFDRAAKKLHLECSSDEKEEAKK